MGDGIGDDWIVVGSDVGIVAGIAVGIVVDIVAAAL